MANFNLSLRFSAPVDLSKLTKKPLILAIHDAMNGAFPLSGVITDADGQTSTIVHGWLTATEKKSRGGRPPDHGKRVAVFLAKRFLLAAGCKRSRANQLLADEFSYPSDADVRRVLREIKNMPKLRRLLGSVLLYGRHENLPPFAAR